MHLRLCCLLHLFSLWPSYTLQCIALKLDPKPDPVVCPLPMRQGAFLWPVCCSTGENKLQKDDLFVIQNRSPATSHIFFWLKMSH